VIRAGFAARPIKGQLDGLWVRALHLRTGRCGVMLLSADAARLSPAVVLEMRATVARATALQECCIFFSHTGIRSPGWLTDAHCAPILDAAVRAAASVSAASRPAQLVFHAGVEFLAIGGASGALIATARPTANGCLQLGEEGTDPAPRGEADVVLSGRCVPFQRREGVLLQGLRVGPLRILGMPGKPPASLLVKLGSRLDGQVWMLGHVNGDAPGLRDTPGLANAVVELARSL
jgi:hypothetical protein